MRLRFHICYHPCFICGIKIKFDLECEWAQDVQTIDLTSTQKCELAGRTHVIPEKRGCGLTRKFNLFLNKR